jgi:hypothetical protein
VLDSTLHRCLNDINLEACGGRVEGFDDGILTRERRYEGGFVLEVSGLDRETEGGTLEWASLPTWRVLTVTVKEAATRASTMGRPTLPVA